MDNRAHSIKNSGRRFLAFSIAIFIIVTSLVVFVRYREFLFPSRTAHLIYNHYADDSTLHSAYVLNYKVNDTLITDVAVLQATNDSSWHLLERDFGIKPIPEEAIGFIDTTLPITWIALLQPYNDSCILSAIFAEKTIYIFSSDKKEIFRDIIYKIFDKTTKQKAN